MAIQQRLERRANRSRQVVVRLVRCVFAVGLHEDTIDDDIEDGITRAKMLIVTNDGGTPVAMLRAGKDDGHGILPVNSKTGKNLTHAAAGDNGFFRAITKQARAWSRYTPMTVGNGRTLESRA